MAILLRNDVVSGFVRVENVPFSSLRLSDETQLPGRDFGGATFLFETSSWSETEAEQANRNSTSCSLRSCTGAGKKPRKINQPGRCREMISPRRRTKTFTFTATLRD